MSLTFDITPRELPLTSHSRIILTKNFICQKTIKAGHIVFNTLAPRASLQRYVVIDIIPKTVIALVVFGTAIVIVRGVLYASRSISHWLILEDDKRHQLRHVNSPAFAVFEDHFIGLPATLVVAVVTTVIVGMVGAFILSLTDRARDKYKEYLEWKKSELALAAMEAGKVA